MVLFLKIETNGLISEAFKPDILSVCVMNASGKIVYASLFGGDVTPESSSIHEITQEEISGLEYYTANTRRLDEILMKNAGKIIVPSAEFYAKILGVGEETFIDLSKLSLDKFGKVKRFYKNKVIYDPAYNGCINMLEYCLDYDLLDLNENEQFISISF